MTGPLIRPGDILADELTELGMTAAELDRALHVPANRIVQVLNGRQAVTADTAPRLVRWFGTGPELWLNLHEQYRLRLLAHKTRGRTSRA